MSLARLFLTRRFQLGDEGLRPLAVTLRHLRQAGLERGDGLVGRFAALRRSLGRCGQGKRGEQQQGGEYQRHRFVSSPQRGRSAIDRTAAIVTTIRSRRHPRRERGLE
jgi:hypothetical protein